MKTSNLFNVALLSVFTMGPLSLTSCKEKGPAERAGEKVDEAVEEVKDEVDDATDSK